MRGVPFFYPLISASVLLSEGIGYPTWTLDSHYPRSTSPIEGDWSFTPFASSMTPA